MNNKNSNKLNKTIKRSITMVLSLVLLLTSLPFTVFADTASPAAETGDEYIYYSDLFYAYSHYLEKAPYLEAYYKDTQGIIDQIHYDYMESPNFFWTDFKASLAKAVDIKEWVKIMSDATGLTTFTYNNALDAANVDVAKQLITATGGFDVYGTQRKWIEKLEGVSEVFDAFDISDDLDDMSETQVFTAMFETLYNSGVLKSINRTMLNSLEQDILPRISDFTDGLSNIADVIEAAKAVSVGIMIEDFRMGLVEDILDSTSSGTVIYDGMDRLKNQLRNGFVSYFVDQYLTDKVLDEIIDGIVRKLTGEILGNQAGVLALVSVVAKIGSWIVFDQLFHVPDIDDVTKQLVLSEYTFNLYDMFVKKTATFNTRFETSDIYCFEELAAAYSAAVKAALNASDKLKLLTNEADLEVINIVYSNADFYGEFIESAKGSVKNTQKEDRIIADHGTWVIQSETAFKNASDRIEDGIMYFPDDGLKANISSSRYDLTIPSDADIIIDGNLSLQDNSLDADLYNYGTLEVTGNVKCDYGCNFYQSEDSAVFKIGGDLIFNTSSSVITAGMVIFNGTKQQNVSNLSACNIEVQNKSGIRYTSNIKLYGCYNLNGNPLDNNGYYTDIYDGYSFGDDSDYKKIRIQSDITLNKDIKGNVTSTSIGTTSHITIPADTNVTVNGSFELSNAVLRNYGSLKIMNDFSNSDDTYNYGTLEVVGNVDRGSGNSRFYQSEDSAVFKVGGDLTFNTSSSVITAGTVVFNGTKQQNVSNLSACNIEVQNKSGIRYTSNIKLYGCYNLNGNPLDNNGYYTDIYDGYSFGDDSDYKKIRIQGVITLNNDIKGNVTTSSTGTTSHITIPADTNVTVNGSFELSNAILRNYGSLKIMNNFSNSDDTYNSGTLEVVGNVDRGSGNSHFYQGDTAVLKVGGDLNFSLYSSTVTAGTVILNGTKQQNVTNLRAPVIILENESDEGVVFKSAITPSVLFDHRGNRFTLYNNGAGSTFADYDGDGLADNVDPYPRDANLYGDIDGDGSINAMDLTALRQYLLGMKGGSFNDGTFDVNRDAFIDIRDLVALKKLLVQLGTFN